MHLHYKSIQLQSEEFYSQFFKNVARYVIYDDHEVANNWDSGMEASLYQGTCLIEMGHIQQCY